ncbi:hypothetical protein [Burkholderia stagnalis]|nr:hypothetical protein [Burkholderia stagnalis]
MLKQFNDVLSSSIRARCEVLQQNPAGARYLLALCSIALTGYALYVVSKH